MKKPAFSNKWILFLLCLFSILFGVFLTLFYLRSISNLSYLNTSGGKPLPETSIRPFIPEPTVEKVEDPSTNEIFGTKCFYKGTDKSTKYIQLDNLPISIPNSLKNLYDIKEEFECVFQGYGDLADGTSGKVTTKYVTLSPIFGFKNPALYLLDKNAEVYRVEDYKAVYNYNDSNYIQNFVSDQNGKIITYKDITFFINILSPGPYGISDKGIWVEVSGYRKINDIVVFWSKIKILPYRSELKDLIGKYGKPVNNPGTNDSPSVIFSGTPEFYNTIYNAYASNVLDNKSPLYETFQSCISDLNSMRYKN